jgi:hypothetical protein
MSCKPPAIANLAPTDLYSDARLPEASIANDLYDSFVIFIVLLEG